MGGLGLLSPPLLEAEPDKETMDICMRDDDICGNAQCRHRRHEHKEGKRCSGFLATKWNPHGEVEDADRECRCPYFHDNEVDYRISAK
jgi:hypothetical protein